eukprot:5922377-Prymnesium_polylepis.1
MAKGNYIKVREKQQAKAALRFRRLSLESGMGSKCLRRTSSNLGGLFSNMKFSERLAAPTVEHDDDDDEEELEIGVLGEICLRTVSFYCIPAVRFVLRALMRAVFMSIYVVRTRFPDFDARQRVMCRSRTPAHECRAFPTVSQPLVSEEPMNRCHQHAHRIMAGHPERYLKGSSGGPGMLTIGAAACSDDSVALGVARSSLSKIEYTWMTFELGIVIDQTYQSFVSGFPSRKQWRLGYTLLSCILVLRTLSIYLP